MLVLDPAPIPSRAPLDVRAILDGEHVVAHFQPLLSFNRRRVVGVEGLCRGWRADTRSLVPAPDLFGAAAAQGLSRPLDLLCRKKVLEGFRALLDRQPHLLLSLNMDPSAIERRMWSGYLRTQIAEAGLNARDVMLEVVESAITDESELQRWVATYREAGHLIALDDVGAGHSNLNRIPRLKPDVIKVDRYLVSGVDADFHKQEVLRSVLGLSRHLGAMTIAEGVETEGEAMTLLGLGVDLVQGFLLARPSPVQEWDDSALPPRLTEIGTRYHERQTLQKAAIRAALQPSFDAVERMRAALAGAHPEGFESALARLAAGIDTIESCFVLDDLGIQQTDTVLNASRAVNRRSELFHPPARGADHGAREYYALAAGETVETTYVSAPRVSLLTGDMCITVATVIHDAGRRRFVLCLDVRAP